MATLKPKSFLGWANGKSTFLPALMERVPKDFNKFCDCTFGTGSMFFGMCPERAILADINRELIYMYRYIRDHTDEVVEELKAHTHEEEYYYKLRAQEPESMNGPARASRFIWLNQTCKHGYYREDEYGRFNLDWGGLKAPRPVTIANLYAVAEALKKDVRLEHYSFEMVREYAEAGDFVYIDPPHLPNNLSTARSVDGFTYQDQKLVASIVRQLDEMGCKVLVTNSDQPIIESLYEGFKIEHVPITKMFLDGDQYKSLQVTELVVRNYE